MHNGNVCIGYFFCSLLWVYIMGEDGLLEADDAGQLKTTAIGK